MGTPKLRVDLYKPLHAFNLKLKISLAEGETLGILGPSGAGKSMTLRMIAGLVKPQRGDIYLGERCLFDSVRHIDGAPQERRIGYVFQDYALFPHLTVAANIAYGISRTIRREARKRRVQDLLAEIHLEEHATRYPSQLSGGQQQRVAIARALAAEPELLLLDEPFSALDLELRRELEQTLLRFRHSRQIPFILVSHNLEEAYRLCDRLAVIENGVILQQGLKDELLRSPQNLQVARKLGVRNFWSGRVTERVGEGGKVWVQQLAQELWVEHLPQSTEVWLGIRPSEGVLLPVLEADLPNVFSVSVVHQVKGVRSHTITAMVHAIRQSHFDASTDRIVNGFSFVEAGAQEMLEIEVPVNQFPKGFPNAISYLQLPPNKLFAFPIRQGDKNELNQLKFISEPDWPNEKSMVSSLSV
ncbi:MAG: sulfate/molybdate ABC transporter ATP-binding protein [Desulfitobacteriaceae bacterium]